MTILVLCQASFLERRRELKIPEASRSEHGDPRSPTPRSLLEFEPFREEDFSTTLENACRISGF